MSISSVLGFRQTDLIEILQHCLADFCSIQRDLEASNAKLYMQVRVFLPASFNIDARKIELILL